MVHHRTYSLEFKRLVAQQYLSGEFALAAAGPRQRPRSRPAAWYREKPVRKDHVLARLDHVLNFAWLHRVDYGLLSRGQWSIGRHSVAVSPGG